MIRHRAAFAAMSFLAAALLVSAGPSAAARPAPAAASDAVLAAKALKLAQTVQPLEMVVEQSVAVLDDQVVAGLMANPDIKRLEAENPGIVAAMWSGAKPTISEILVQSVPDLWSALAAVYAKHFTSAQLDEVIGFFESPTGRKFVIGMHRNIDVKPMIRDAVGTRGQLSEKTYTQTVSGAANATAEAMSPAETAEFERFLATPTGKIVAGVGPDVTSAILEWTNRRDPKADARIEAAMIKAMEKFLGDRPQG
jgi:hypothetical protein